MRKKEIRRKRGMKRKGFRFKCNEARMERRKLLPPERVREERRGKRRTREGEKFKEKIEKERDREKEGERERRKKN